MYVRLLLEVWKADCSRANPKKKLSSRSKMLFFRLSITVASFAVHELRFDIT